MEPVLIVFAAVLVIIILLFLMPEFWRQAARRNNRRRQVLKAALDDLGESLRTLAARLRPYRDMEADIFRRRYEPARERLQQVVDDYRALTGAVARMTPVDTRKGRWAFPHFVQHPQDLVTVPRNALRLWQIRRDLDDLHGALGDAEKQIAQAEEAPNLLAEAARELSERRLPALAETVAGEQDAGLSGLDQLAARRERLQQQATSLESQLQARPMPALGRLNTLAGELNELQVEVARLEQDVAGLQRERRAVDRHLQEADEARAAAQAAAGDDAVQEGLAPLLGYAEELTAEARRLRQAGHFDRAQTQAQEARDLLKLVRNLGTAAQQVRSLLQVSDVSLQAEAIDVLSRRLYTAFRAAYTLAGVDAAAEKALSVTGAAEVEEDSAPPPSDQSFRQALDGLLPRAARLAAEAQELEEAHREDVARMEAEANERVQAMTEAWQALQQTVALNRDDPAARHFRQLLEEQGRAADNPQELQAFIEDVESMTSEIKSATTTIEEGMERLETLRSELPSLLETAETEAENWHCLRPYLHEMKEATATIWQIGGGDVHLSEMQAILAEIDVLEDQARASYAALSGERRRLSVLEQRIEHTLRAGTLRRAEAPERRRSDLRQQVDEQLTAARSAETVEAAHLALRETLEWLQEEVGA